MKLIPRDFIFDDFFDFFPTTKSSEMKCDIYEKDNHYHIEMDIPGYEKKDIKIEEENGYLTITAEKNSQTNEENKNYIRKERSSSRYQRSFYLGNDVENNIKADFKDGLLKVVIPKKENVETKRIIEID